MPRAKKSNVAVADVFAEVFDGTPAPEAVPARRGPGRPRKAAPPAVVNAPAEKPAATKAAAVTPRAHVSQTNFDPGQLLQDLAERIRSIRLDALPDVVQALNQATAPRGAASSSTEVVESMAKKLVALTLVGSKLDIIQRAVVAHALSECNGNVSAAARLLGMERKALERKVHRYSRGGSDDED